jgi:hypothetical protein
VHKINQLVITADSLQGLDRKANTIMRLLFMISE